MTHQIAFLGTGHIHTPGFIKSIQARQDVKIKYVYDHDAARAQKNATNIGCQVATAEAIAADKDVKAVFICSETLHHEKLALQAIAAGKHCFIEKPLGFGGADAQKVAQALNKSNLLFTTGYFFRTMPVHIWLKREIDKASFGKISRVRHVTGHAGSLKGWFDTDWRWMADPAQAGCGALGDLGTHSLDLLMWLMGPVKAVTGTAKVYTNRYPGCDESGEALLEFANGAAGTFAGSWLDWANPLTCQVSGTEGYAHILDGKLYAVGKAFGNEGPALKEITDLPPAEKGPLDRFLDALTSGDKTGLVTPDEAAARSVAMAGVYRSIQSGQRIVL
jgi:1,5-anhydro-D-fructose reductase (1,5-anhydro-D-mannitol-forming)